MSFCPKCNGKMGQKEVVCPRCGYDFPDPVEKPGRKMPWWLHLILLITFATVIILFNDRPFVQIIMALVTVLAWAGLFLRSWLFLRDL